MHQYLVGFIGLVLTFFFFIWFISRPSSGKPLSKRELGYSLILALIAAIVLTLAYAAYFTLLPFLLNKALLLLQ